MSDDPQKQLQSWIDKIEGDKSDRFCTPSTKTTIFKQMAESATTVSDSDIKLLLSTIKADVSAYTGQNNSSVVVDSIRTIGKKIGWSVIYVLLKTMKCNPQAFEFLLDTCVYVNNAEEYVLISRFGDTTETEAQLLTLVRSRDDTWFNGIEISFADTEAYLKIPQYVGDIHSTFTGL